jgi:hypothetical protein
MWRTDIKSSRHTPVIAGAGVVIGAKCGIKYAHFYFVHGIPTENQFVHLHSRFNDKTRIRVAQTAFILCSMLLDLRLVSDASD